MSEDQEIVNVVPITIDFRGSKPKGGIYVCEIGMKFAYID